MMIILPDLKKQMISKNKHTFCQKKDTQGVNNHFITNVFQVLEKCVCQEGAWGLLLFFFSNWFHTYIFFIFILFF